MIFQRRVKRTLPENIRESLWPSMGWRRAARYVFYRIVRLPDTPHRVAAGFAIGAGVSFSPLLGTHIMQTLFFCWLLRANYAAGLIGTLLGNPWMLPLLFWSSYESGILFMELFGHTEFMPRPETFDWQHLLAHPVQLLLPFVIGGYLCAIAFFPLFYTLAYSGVKLIRRARKAAIIHSRKNQLVRDFRANS